MFDVPAGAVHLAAKGGQHEVRTMHVFSKGCKDHNLPNLNLNYPPHSIYIVFTVSVYMSLWVILLYSYKSYIYFVSWIDLNVGNMLKLLF